MRESVSSPFVSPDAVSLHSLFWQHVPLDDMEKNVLPFICLKLGS